MSLHPKASSFFDPPAPWSAERRAGFFVPVLMYHHVEPAPLDPPPRHADSYVTPETFAAQLDLLARRGFTPWTLAGAAATFHAGEPLPPRAVVLTFDDACRCFARHAWPLLAERRMRATLFAVSGELGGHNRWDAAAGERHEELLDAAELRDLADQGVEIGCHGATHADLSTLDGDEGALEHETREARRLLQNAVYLPVTTFAYPYGRSSPAAQRAVRAAGFHAAVSILDHPGARAGDPWAVPRLPVRPGEGGLELWLKARGVYPTWSRLPRLGLLSSLRHRSHPAATPPEEVPR